MRPCLAQPSLSTSSATLNSSAAGSYLPAGGPAGCLVRGDSLGRVLAAGAGGVVGPDFTAPFLPGPVPWGFCRTALWCRICSLILHPLAPSTFEVNYWVCPSGFASTLMHSTGFDTPEPSLITHFTAVTSFC